MLPISLTTPLRLAYADRTGPFALEATVTAVEATGADPGGAVATTLTLGAGTLHDADKGRCVLDGLVVTLRYEAGRFEPDHAHPPHPLSELQEAGLLDAVASALNALVRPSGAPEPA